MRELDDLVRQIILIRDGLKCVRCNAQGIGRGGRTIALQAAHILPKGQYPALRHELLNVILLCWTCHLGPSGWHKNPLAARDWLVSKYGQPYVDHLTYLAQVRSKVDRKGVKVMLQQVLGQLRGE